MKTDLPEKRRGKDSSSNSMQKMVIFQSLDDILDRVDLLQFNLGKLFQIAI